MTVPLMVATVTVSVALFILCYSLSRLSFSFVAATRTMQVLGTGFDFCFQHFQLHPLPSTDTNPVDDNYMGSFRLTLINDPIF